MSEHATSSINISQMTIPQSQPTDSRVLSSTSRASRAAGARVTVRYRIRAGSNGAFVDVMNQFSCRVSIIGKLYSFIFQSKLN